jgi:hypothetical protein
LRIILVWICQEEILVSGGEEGSDEGDIGEGVKGRRERWKGVSQDPELRMETCVYVIVILMAPGPEAGQ